MLAMSFVYFNIWQIKQTEPSDFKKGLIGFPRDEKILLEATSPFAFSIVPECTMLRFIKLIACDNGKIHTCTKLVDDRNKTTYPNGNIFFSEQSALDLKIMEILVTAARATIRQRSLRYQLPLLPAFLSGLCRPDIGDSSQAL
jgi:hypothetical protein